MTSGRKKFFVQLLLLLLLCGKIQQPRQNAAVFLPGDHRLLLVNILLLQVHREIYQTTSRGCCVTVEIKPVGPVWVHEHAHALHRASGGVVPSPAPIQREGGVEPIARQTPLPAPGGLRAGRGGADGLAELLGGSRSGPDGGRAGLGHLGGQGLLGRDGVSLVACRVEIINLLSLISILLLIYLGY